MTPKKRIKHRKLRAGFTTGTAAAAATKGALRLLFENRIPSKVQIELLTGDPISIPIHHCKREDPDQALCTVIKDAGDDPDITHKAEIGARVRLKERRGREKQGDPISITGGKGVGTVTKPGLETPPGESAITSGPRKMISQAVQDIVTRYDSHVSVSVEIFVPEGEILAQKTLNARLGIMGGLSILGTTGIVKPMSHDAYIATIRSAVSVARASGVEHLILTTGRRSERFAQRHWQELPEEAFVQIGDFFKLSLAAASKKGFQKISLAVFFGKALKMAQGIPHTHAGKSTLTMDRLSTWSRNVCRDQRLAQRILKANTARHSLEMVREDCPELVAHVGRRVVQSAQKFAGGVLDIQNVIFDYDGNVLYSSKKKRGFIR
jgi:cobalt-precorrin-5B (C1)-methyltransferase